MCVLFNEVCGIGRSEWSFVYWLDLQVMNVFLWWSQNDVYECYLDSCLYALSKDCPLRHKTSEHPHWFMLHSPTHGLWLIKSHWWCIIRDLNRYDGDSILHGSRGCLFQEMKGSVYIWSYQSRHVVSRCVYLLNSNRRISFWY